ncbi:hypothetical protein F2Q70_00039601 [Brassica cretica]|uniref:Uncharacterized protein n=1 Tax=Brassica cretica TaxID=69181 RepID=A0A8S9K3J6_BRACR|nr:hypothetical protein F2Q70_00039601 [Brassica cretica]
MVRRLPQNISFEHAWEIRPLHMFFKNCRESQEETKALFTEALTPSLKVTYPIPPRHLMDPISAEQLAGFRKMSEIKEFMDEDLHTDTKKLCGNAKVKEKVQKKRVKGDPIMTLIPHMCEKNSIEYEVKCKGTSKPFSKVKVNLSHELKDKR